MPTQVARNRDVEARLGDADPTSFRWTGLANAADRAYPQVDLSKTDGIITLFEKVYEYRKLSNTKDLRDSMSNIALEDQIIRRLNLLILLELDKVTPESRTTVTSKVHWLLGLGLPPAEVASIVGKPVNYVTAITSSAKKASKKKDQRRGDE